jgi:NAD(P)-dependent dehydrogenase (short-subunit alcohol dehydrogenase family)
MPSSDQSPNHTADPRYAGPRPPYEADTSQKQPGEDRQLITPADHGEESYRGAGRLEGRVALITGGDSGIGRAIAIAYAREGADVAIAHLPEEAEDAKTTSDLVTQAGRRALSIPRDLTTESACIEVIEKVVEELGRLDVLINNAAYQMTHKDIDEWSSDEWDHTFRVNVFAMFYLCKAALKHLPPGGSIINTASIQSLQPKSHLLAYAASKGAVLNFTKALAQLAIEQGVRVNAVAPGPVWTPLIPSTMPEEKTKSFGENTLFGRAAQPVEIAPAYVYLASKDAQYLTGELIPITGGKTPL